MTDTSLVPVRRALLSVSDKMGLEDLARRLATCSVQLISTGGTATRLREAGLGVRDVSEITQFPEMMGGRVKTLHPMVHGGLLADRLDSAHVEAMDVHGIAPIDLAVVNLYPFEAAIARGAAFEECIENIDIGGPAMIRSAAKNHASVAVVVDTIDYDEVIDEIERTGGTTLATRKRLAARALARTAAYDAAIATWLSDAIGQSCPRRKIFYGHCIQELRYGENPHQTASFFANGESGPGIATATQLQGKALSYNNINDTDAALMQVAEFPPKDGTAVAIVKHANPCGVATGASLADAYRAAYDCDRVSAFGGIVALNQRLDAETAALIAEIFTEVVIAPGVDPAARDVFQAKPNLRLMVTDGLPTPPKRTFRQVSGGFLVQDPDTAQVTGEDLRLVTKRAPSEAETADLLFAWRVAKHVKSNAIVYAKGGATVGIGAGQMSRVDSARIAAAKAQDMAEALSLSQPPTVGSVVASDAFFPFPDGMLTAAKAGATAVIQPGGSVRDEEVIAAADEAGLAMVFTGIRHFRH